MSVFGAGRARVAPWGWWLRVVGNAVEDADGRRFGSVRQAFWEGHLRFPPTHFVPEQLELLLRVLAAIDHQWTGSEERKQDLFGGDMLFWRYYQCWLSSLGLLGSDRAQHSFDPLSAGLSDLGASVLAMLQATREPAWVALPFDAVLDIVRDADRGEPDQNRERALRAFERGIVQHPYLFAREILAGLFAVTLTGLDTHSRMPMRKVMWSQAFTDERVRDDIFAWLAVRVVRWEDWGEMAFRKGADALTSHLLGLFAAGLSSS